MQRLSHLPLEIDAKQAKQTITELDWPSGPAAALGSASRKLLWLPFDATSGNNLTDGRQDPNLAQIALSLPTIPTGTIVEGPPPGPCSTINGENGDVLFAPFFLFNGREPDNTWAAVDGFNGQVAGGRLKAKDHASVARLALLVFLALFTFYAATAYVNLLLTSVFGVLGPMLRLTQGFLQVVSIGFVLALFYWLFRWMMGQRKRLSDWLREPVARVESGVISLPLEQSWLALLRALSNVSLILLPLIALSLLVPMPGSGIATVPARLLQFGLALALGISARRLSRGDWLKQAPATNGVRPSAVIIAKKGHTQDLVSIVLDVALFAMYGTVVGHMLDLFDLGGWLRQDYGIDSGLFSALGAAVGAFFGVVISSVSGRARITLAVSLAFGLVTDLLFSPWLSALVLFSLVGITSWLTTREDASTNRGDPPYWRALRTAWAFVFGGIIGSIAGSVIGFVIMGPVGMVAGSFLGDQILATAGLMSQQNSSASD